MPAAATPTAAEAVTAKVLVVEPQTGQARLALLRSQIRSLFKLAAAVPASDLMFAHGRTLRHEGGIVEFAFVGAAGLTGGRRTLLAVAAKHLQGGERNAGQLR